MQAIKKPSRMHELCKPLKTPPLAPKTQTLNQFPAPIQQAASGPPVSPETALAGWVDSLDSIQEKVLQADWR
jgi:hypothetical protein